MVWKITSIHELRTFRCDIYPIKPSPKKIDDKKKIGFFMCYTSRRAILKWWDLQTKKLKYFSSAKFNEHKKIQKIMVTWIWIDEQHKYFRPSKTKIDILDHPWIKYDIFEATVIFPPILTPVGIISKYCEHHNISYFNHSTNYSSCNNAFYSRNRTNVWILNTGRKDPKSVQVNP